MSDGLYDTILEVVERSERLVETAVELERRVAALERRRWATRFSNAVVVVAGASVVGFWVFVASFAWSLGR